MGVSETLGGLFNGHMQDAIGPRKMIWIYFIETLAAVLMILFYAYTNSFSMYMACALCFVWGVQDSGVNNYIWCVCGFEFNHPNRPFSLFFFVQSLSCFISLQIESFVVTREDYLIYYTAFGLFGMFAWLIMLTFDFKSDNKDVDESYIEEKTTPLKISLIKD